MAVSGRSKSGIKKNTSKRTSMTRRQVSEEKEKLIIRARKVQRLAGPKAKVRIKK